mmetsp:Transcript_27300/g.69465  ORF Transcript_27300/g.69465 Transcript_27300/m.69465 type:complete len:209 (-) Transcript_27300:238-864(-)
MCASLPCYQDPAITPEGIHCYLPLRLTCALTNDHRRAGYLEPTGNQREARRAKLKERFGFDCVCRRCTLDGDELEASESRQLALQSIGSDNEQPLSDLLCELQLLLDLMTLEGMPHVWVWKSQLLRLLEASMRELATGDEEVHERALRWADTASASICLAMGNDHPSFDLTVSFAEMLRHECGCAQRSTKHKAAKARRRFFDLAKKFA